VGWRGVNCSILLLFCINRLKRIEPLVRDERRMGRSMRLEGRACQEIFSGGSKLALACDD